MSKVKKIIVFGVLLIVFLIVLSGGKGKPEETSGKLKVSASFYPLAFFAEEIGGDRIDVFTITPPGTEPHDYEPTARDIARITDGKILFLNGNGLEVWRDDITKNLSPKDTSLVVVGEKITLLKEEGKEAEYAKDPHVWLSPVLAKQMIDKIVLALEQADPKNASYYASNATSLRSRLDSLNEEFKKGLSNCAKKDFITSHMAFGSLAREYGLKQMPIAGISPEEEPSSKDIAILVEFAKKNNVKYIFFESLVSPKLSEMLANEVGAKTLVLNPLEGLTQKETIEGKDYFSEMYQNLINLQTALECTTN